MTPEEARALPVAVDVTTAAKLLGVSASSAYDMIAAGNWPTPIVRLGRRIRIPSAPLLARLGIERGER